MVPRRIVCHVIPKFQQFCLWWCNIFFISTKVTWFGRLEIFLKKFSVVIARNDYSPLQSLIPFSCKIYLPKFISIWFFVLRKCLKLWDGLKPIKQCPKRHIILSKRLPCCPKVVSMARLLLVSLKNSIFKIEISFYIMQFPKMVNKPCKKNKVLKKFFW